ncbi:RNA helicase family protein [Perilla frutescens var. hirtella]|nr:RNA helicase family protein [Perilla frutescens var. hirtella]
MSMHTIFFKENEGINFPDSTNGPRPEVPLWSVVGSEPAPAAYNNHYQQSKPPSLGVSAGRNLKLAAAKQSDQALAKKDSTHFSVFPAGDCRTAVMNGAKTTNYYQTTSLGYDQGQFKLGLAQPLICGQYPYNNAEQCYGIYSAHGAQIEGRHIMVALSMGSEGGPIFVNAKQYNGIMRRRRWRAKAESKNQDMIMKLRKRGSGGRFLSTKKMSEKMQGDERENHHGSTGTDESQISEVLQSTSSPVSEKETMDQNEWWGKIEQMKTGNEQEMVIRRNFGRDDQQILADMAYQLGLYLQRRSGPGKMMEYFCDRTILMEKQKSTYHVYLTDYLICGLYLWKESHAYNKGKALVVSKVPLPNYRADLDEQHGSNKTEIKMSTEIEERVGHILKNTNGTDLVQNNSSSSSGSATLQSKPVEMERAASLPEIDTDFKGLNIKLKQKQEKMREGDSVKAMLAFREKLPAFKVKSEFLKAVASNQVLVVSGETGCGKTTQLPQFILEEEISSLRGASCNIICTQPRRISAISVAARISAERGEELGETVGYQIRLESNRSAQTRLLFCTTGVLLRQLVQDPNLTGITHLLVDEIHERGMNEDFLLIILRDILPRRPNLRVVLMSATINAELFSKYFGNTPTIHIPGLTFPVKELYLEDVLEKTRHTIQPESENLPRNSRRGRRQQEPTKDPLTELFEDTDIDALYKSYSASTRQSLEAWSGSQLDLGLVEAAIEHICRHEGNGAILVFLTGWDEISKLLDKLRANIFVGDSNKFLVLPLHGSMPTLNQREIFDRPPPNVRKIVLATNIAESSITIDDVVYVIDCGKAKETSYDALNKLACLLPSWISKASAHQRRGRAGRVQPGVCYRLYPKIIHDAMPQYQLPEMLRTPLQELCLHIKSLQLGVISTFLAKAVQPPDPLSVENAIELLKTIGALDDREELTPLGRHLSTLPLDPNIGKMLLMGSIFQCVNPALTIAAAVAHRSPFVLPLSRKEEAEAAKRSFAGDSCSDHIALLKAYEGWKDAKRNRNEKAFCWDNFLSPVTMQMIEDMRYQFLDLLAGIGFVDKSHAKAYNQYSDDLEMVCAILCAGLYPNVVQCKRRGKRTALYTKEVGKVDIHPGSVNAGVHIFPLPYMVYSEKVKTSSIYLRDSTNISDYALLMFGGNLLPSKSGDGIEMLGGYLHFSSSKTVLDLIRKLRGELDRLLTRKIEEPALDITVEGKGVVAAVIELLHSQNVRYR